MSEHDQLIMKNEAELYSSFNNFQDLLSRYINLYPMVEFSTSNSKDANKFLSGMMNLKQSFDALVEALNIQAQILGVEPEQN